MSKRFLPITLLLFFLSHTTYGIRSKGPPKLTSKVHSEKIGYTNQTLLLPCSIEAYPKPYYKWYKDKDEVNWSWSGLKHLKSGSLEILNASIRDTGKYACLAVNGFGSKRITYDLLVLEKNDQNNAAKRQDDLENKYSKLEDGKKPTFTRFDSMKRLVKVRKSARSYVNFECSTTSNPKGEIKWFKDGLLIHPNSSHFSFYKSKLIIRYVQSKDQGYYTCQVVNHFGSINFTFNLQVIDYIGGPHMPGEHPINTTAISGDSASFQCQIKSEIKPHVQWLRKISSEELDVLNPNTTISVGGSKYAILENGQIWSLSNGYYMSKLNIINVQPLDEGLYLCLSANSLGYNYRTAFLSVSKKDKEKGKEVKWNVGSNWYTFVLIIFPVFAILVVIFIAIFIYNRLKLPPNFPSKSISQKNCEKCQATEYAPTPSLPCPEYSSTLLSSSHYALCNNAMPTLNYQKMSASKSGTYNQQYGQFYCPKDINNFKSYIL